MRRVVFTVLAVVVGLTGLAFAGDYTCKVCYEPVPTDKVACETLMAPTYDMVLQMVMASSEEKQRVNRVIVECSFPQCTKKGYTGYRAVVEFKR